MSRVAVCAPHFNRKPELRDELRAIYPDVTFHEELVELRGENLINFLKGHDKAITCLEVLNDAVFTAVPELRVVGKVGVGLDMIDLPAMARHGVELGWVGGINRRSVSELALQFMLNLLRKIYVVDRDLRQGVYQRQVGNMLTDRTVGIVGCGFIGKDLTHMLKPFGCRILANDIRDFAAFYEANGVEPVGLEELLRESDVVTLHTPLDASTRGMISTEQFALMKPSALLLNTARGGIVDEAALKVALRDKQIAGAAFDVFVEEPMNDRELLDLPNFLATTHIGGSCEEMILAMAQAAISGLDNARLPDPDWLDAWPQ